MSNGLPTKSFEKQHNQELDIRVARTLLPLMAEQKWHPPEIFEHELKPSALGTGLPALKKSVDRLMQQLVLDNFSSVTEQNGNVVVAINTAALQEPAVQKNIATELRNVNSPAGQLTR